MASSNRHWPSMFKSKPCNSPHQWQHDINPSLMSSGCHRNPYTSVSGCEERSPEPKPRWNPKPEQIRILEAIFNSGMVNPPRDEIRKIRSQLQEYGQVGDANVFYWFQNRKSRSKHKLRHLQNSKQQTPTPPSATAPSSSSSSSEKSSPKAPTRAFSMGFSNLVTEANINNNFNSSTSPTASVNQTIFQNNNISSHEFLTDPHFFFPAVHQSSCSTITNTTTQGFCFPTHNQELSTGVVLPHEVQNMGPCTSLLLSEIMNHHHHGAPSSKKDHHDHEENYNKVLMKMDDPHELNYTSLTPQTPSSTANLVVSSHHATSGTTTVSAPPVPVNQVQGVREEGAVGPSGGAKTTVFINDVAFEVTAGPFNVHEAFGEDAVLIHSYGQPVLTNEWGVTLHSLQHGAFYYLI